MLKPFSNKLQQLTAWTLGFGCHAVIFMNKPWERKFRSKLQLILKLPLEAAKDSSTAV